MSAVSHKPGISLLALLLVGVLVSCTAGVPEAADRAAVELITLERAPCFGTCPVYTLSLHGDGTVEYEGLNFVEVTGPQTATVDPAAVQALGDAMAEAGYFEWEDAYVDYQITDLPYATSSVTLSDGTTKRIEHYYGDSSAPDALTELETLIDETANAQQWIGD